MYLYAPVSPVMRNAWSYSCEYTFSMYSEDFASVWVER